MDRNKYYSIREDIDIMYKITKQIDVLNDIMETYWQTKSMTLEDAKEFLWERWSKFNDKVEQELDVK